MLGTPNEDNWPGVSSLPDYKSTFPQWSKQDLARVIPTLDDAGIDILKVTRRTLSVHRYILLMDFQRTLTYDAAKRISGTLSRSMYSPVRVLTLSQLSQTRSRPSLLRRLQTLILSKTPRSSPSFASSAHMHNYFHIPLFHICLVPFCIIFWHLASPLISIACSRHPTLPTFVVFRLPLSTLHFVAITSLKSADCFRRNEPNT
jgi:hypothetical protein